MTITSTFSNVKANGNLDNYLYDYNGRIINDNIKIIAEDLGDLFPSVIELRDRLNLPGMYM